MPITIRTAPRMSIPLLGFATSRAISSAGRAPPRQGGGHWFEPSIAHLREPACSAGSRRSWGARGGNVESFVAADRPLPLSNGRGIPTVVGHGGLAGHWPCAVGGSVGARASGAGDDRRSTSFCRLCRQSASSVRYGRFGHHHGSWGSSAVTTMVRSTATARMALATAITADDRDRRSRRMGDRRRRARSFRVGVCLCCDLTA